jgi:hypothetical protein
MKPEFRVEVDRYKGMPPEMLDKLVAETERMRRSLDSMMSAMRRAQKEQKRLAGSGAD